METRDPRTCKLCDKPGAPFHEAERDGRIQWMRCPDGHHWPVRLAEPTD